MANQTIKKAKTSLSVEEKILKLADKLPELDLLMTLPTRLERYLGYKELNNLFYQADSEKYHYYCSDCLKRVVAILMVIKSKSMLDLGCGTGLFGKVITLIFKLYKKEFEFHGIEIEPQLLELANRTAIHQSWITENKSSISLGDITKLSKIFVERFDTIYFWEPIIDRKLVEKFINSLEKSTKPGQYIIYRCHGKIIKYLENSSKFKRLARIGDITLYQVI